jgi:glutamyl-tRNA reductase
MVVRERLACPPAALPVALARLRAVTTEGFLISTCNRVEVYALVEPDLCSHDRLIQLFTGDLGPSRDWLMPHLYLHQDAAAVRQLFTVAAGLDSMVVGEDQILAQVKTALDAAHAAQTLGPILYRLGHMALATGKRVRAGTGINRYHLSVVSLGLRLATEHLGSLQGRAVLIIGAGHTAELALKHLVSRGRAAPAITLVNRTDERATALAARYQAQALPWSALERAVSNADLVISCTSAPHAVLTAGQITAVLARRCIAAPESALFATHEAGLVLLDLAVPRDIDPAVAALPGVRLYDVDSLQAMCADNRQHRLAEIGHAAALIDQAVEQFMAWGRARAAVPTITALRAHADAICAAEVARTLARLPDLTPREAEAVQYLATALVNKLLHMPMRTLQSAPDPASLAALVQDLFHLSAAVPPDGEDGVAPTVAPAVVSKSPDAGCSSLPWPPLLVEGDVQYT